MDDLGTKAQVDKILLYVDETIKENSDQVVTTNIVGVKIMEMATRFTGDDQSQLLEIYSDSFSLRVSLQRQEVTVEAIKQLIQQLLQKDLK